MPSDPLKSPRIELEPGVQRFVTETSSMFSTFPPLASLAFSEARRIAEIVRERWREGGPTMLAITEHSVPASSSQVRVRLYDPGPAGAKPALVYLHGGGWTLFSIDTHDRVMREYAARAGICVVGVDYSLSPENKFPRALEEVVAIVRWLHDHGAGLRIDAFGGSDPSGRFVAYVAKGRLVLRDAGQAGYARAMLLNYAAFDVESSEWSAQTFGGDGNMLCHDEMQAFWRNYLRSPDDAQNPLACPMKARLEGIAARIHDDPRM